MGDVGCRRVCVVDVIASRDVGLQDWVDDNGQDPSARARLAPQAATRRSRLDGVTVGRGTYEHGHVGKAFRQPIVGHAHVGCREIALLNEIDAQDIG